MMTALPDVIAQLAPGAATETLLYDCPQQTLAEVESVMVCNRGAAADNIRVSISKLGAATATKDYLYYDLPVTGNDSFMAAIGLKTRAGDIIRVRSLLGTCSFTLLGSITSPVQAR